MLDWKRNIREGRMKHTIISMHRTITCLSSLIIGASVCGQCEIQRLTAEVPIHNGQFGFDVDLSGDVLVANSRIDIGGPSLIGAVEIYERQGDAWKRVQTLVSPASPDSTRFGKALKLDGDELFVSAVQGTTPDGRVDEAGVVYYYQRQGGTWSLNQVLSASDATTGAWFGWSLAVQDDTLVVGAINPDGVGRAYVFEFDGASWFQTAKLTAGDRDQVEGEFGCGVAIEDDLIAVGAWFHDIDDFDRVGETFLFRLISGAWIKEDTIRPLELHEAMFSGSTVTIDDGRVATGHASYKGGYNHLAAALFERVQGEWSMTADLDVQLAPTDGTGFIWSATHWIDWRGDELVVGAPQEYFGPAGSEGVVTVYQSDGSDWFVAGRIRGSDLLLNSDYGVDLARDDDRIIVGARRQDNGTVYIHEDWVLAHPCDGDLDSDSFVTVADLLTMLSDWGPCAGCAGDLNLDGEVNHDDLDWLLTNWNTRRD